MSVSRVHRLLRLVTVLQGGRPRPASELVHELGISRRTLFRDLAMLQAAGIPYYHEPGQGYRIRKGYFLPPTSLTVQETLGLMTLAAWAAAQRKRPLLGAGLSAIHKLVATVPEPMRSACAEMMGHVSVDAGAALDGDEGRHYGLLHRCIDERRACRIQYRGPLDDQPWESTLHPYTLHFGNRAWYVLGHTALHGEVRILKLVRLQAVEPLDHTFRRPAGFDARRKLGNAWQLNPEGQEHDVELEFTRLVATNVAEVRWHPTQQAEPLPDGGLRLRFRVDGLGEIAWWICGYADQVVVRRPAALRQLVRRRLQDALARYDDPPTPRSPRR